MALIGNTEINVVRFLRSNTTHRYFTGHDWSDEIEKAKIYDNDIDAALSCVESDLRDVDLVLRMPEGGTDLFCTRLR